MVAVFTLGWKFTISWLANSLSTNTMTSLLESFINPKGVTDPGFSFKYLYKRSSDANDNLVLPICLSKAFKSTLLFSSKTTK